MMYRKESEVLQQCMDFLQLNNIFCWRNNTGALKVNGRYVRFGYAGSPDIIGITKDGKFLGVECKREKGGVLSEAQKHFRIECKIRGGVYIVANSLETLVNELHRNHVIGE